MPLVARLFPLSQDAGGQSGLCPKLPSTLSVIHEPSVFPRRPVGCQ